MAWDPSKKLGLDIETVKMPDHETESYKLEVIQEANRWDYLISPNAYSTRVFRQAFHYGNIRSRISAK